MSVREMFSNGNLSLSDPFGVKASKKRKADEFEDQSNQEEEEEEQRLPKRQRREEQEREELSADIQESLLLPNDSVFLIFSYLEDAKSLLHASLTCKQWHSICT